MPNYFVSYEVKGQRPSRDDIESHLAKLAPSVLSLLNNVWYINYEGDVNSVYQHVNKLVPATDRLLVIDAKTCEWRNLIAPSDHLKNSWER
jgi:hypothetical protein